MSLLNFLKSSTVEEVKATAARGGGVRKQWNPAPVIVAIRLWKDGSVFPSDAAVKKLDLGYKTAILKKEAIKLKDGETEQKYRNIYEFPFGTGNGLDFIDSRVWQHVSGEGAMLFVATVPKNAGKVDLFNTVSYEEDGTPKVSVMEQGAATFGQQVMLKAVEEVYGIKFNRDEVEATDTTLSEPAITDGVDFVDLAIFESIGEGDQAFNVTEKYSKSIIFAPKRVVRGADKGKADYERRENVKVYGLAPAADVLPGYKAEDVPAEEPALVK